MGKDKIKDLNWLYNKMGQRLGMELFRKRMGLEVESGIIFKYMRIQVLIRKQINRL